MSRRATIPMYGKEEDDPDSTAISFGATHAVSPTVAAYDELLHCVNYELPLSNQRGWFDI
jgi:hypothetical protein